MLQYFLFRLLAVVVPLLPRRFGLWLFGLPAPLVARIAGTRHAVRDNMRHVLGEGAAQEEIDRCVEGVFRHQLWNYCDMFHAPRLTPDEVLALVTVKHREDILRAVRHASGVVLVTPHFGNLDITSRVFGALGFRGVAVVEHLEPEQLFDFVCQLRAQEGVEFVPVEHAPKTMLRAIREGRAVYLAADRDVSGTAVPVEFFGAPALLPDGYARLARHAGAPIVVAATSRLEDHTFEIESWFLPEREATDDRDADIAAIQRQVLKALEPYMAQRPEQWVLFQSVWGR